MVLGTTLPFIRRAYFVDDHYFVAIARGILAHPTRPYDFKSDDAGLQVVGWQRGEKPRMVNPLLFHYYLAAVIRCWGDAVWKLRASSLVFSLLAVGAMYFLGRRFTDDPFYPALLMAVTPAYWLTSYSLLIDSALIGLFLAALWTFMIGLETRRTRWIFLSGVLMGATILTKYFGVLIVPLALLWQWLHPNDRRWRSGYVAYGICAVLLFLWSVWNYETYGAAHMLASFSRGVKANEPFLFYWYKILAVASFIGGGTIFLLAVPFCLWRMSRLVVGALGLLTIVLYLTFHSATGGFTAAESAQLTIWIGVAFAFVAALAINGWPRETSDQFLYAWVFLGVAELIVVMPWTAGRYMLCVLPAVIWLFARILNKAQLTVWRYPILALTAVVGLALADADYVQANCIEALAHQLQRIGPQLQRLAPRPAHWYYLADTFDGSQPYLEPLGWQNVFPNQTFHKGDLFLRAHYRKSSWWKMTHMDRFRPVWTYEVTSRNPLRVMDVPASAGWYASCWGALPFTWTDHPLERFDLYQATADTQ